MAILTVRNVPDEVKRALRVKAALHNRSMEAEIREILEATVKPKIKLGSLLKEIGQQLKLTDEECAMIEGIRDKTSAEVVDFE